MFWKGSSYSFPLTQISLLNFTEILLPCERPSFFELQLFPGMMAGGILGMLTEKITSTGPALSPRSYLCVCLCLLRCAAPFIVPRRLKEILYLTTNRGHKRIPASLQQLRTFNQNSSAAIDLFVQINVSLDTCD